MSRNVSLLFRVKTENVLIEGNLTNVYRLLTSPVMLLTSLTISVAYLVSHFHRYLRINLLNTLQLILIMARNFFFFLKIQKCLLYFFLHSLYVLELLDCHSIQFLDIVSRDLGFKIFDRNLKSSYQGFGASLENVCVWLARGFELIGGEPF